MACHMSCLYEHMCHNVKTSKKVKHVSLTYFLVVSFVSLSRQSVTSKTITFCHMLKQLSVKINMLKLETNVELLYVFLLDDFQLEYLG